MSNSLVPLYRAMAVEKGNFFGLAILVHQDLIGELLARHGARTLIDWGCGRGDAYKAPHNVWRHWAILPGNITLYDPSFKQHEVPPMHNADAVLCSDVLEHIPEAEIDEFVAGLFARADLFVWAAFCNRPAKKKFPGTQINLHCTLHDMAWWTAKFTEHASGKPFYLTESE